MESSALIQRSKEASVGFVDGPLNGTICQWFLSIGVESILSTNQPRRLHESWHKYPFTISHKDYGGVTNAVIKFFFITQQQCVQKENSNLKHSRDAYTILDDSIWCTRKRRKPAPLDDHRLEVVNVGSTSYPIFHIGGLLPCLDIKSCTITAPGIGLENKVWGVRRLTRGEILNALDMSADVVPDEFNWKVLVTPHIIPAMCWFIGAVSWLGVANESAFSRLESAPPLKRVRINTVCPPDMGIDQKELLCVTSTIKRDQVAVKSDDATVDLDIWFNNILNGGGVGSVLVSPDLILVEGTLMHSALSIVRKWLLMKAMDVLRKYLLWKWKRKLLLEYRVLLRNTCDEWKAYMDSWSISTLVVWDGNGFTWSPQGKKVYKKGYNSRLLSCTMDWMKGSDALIRALRCSWWDWEDGSAPFYWRWPLWYQSYIRDGIAFPFHHAPPRYMVPQRDIDDVFRKGLVIRKLKKVMDRRYLGEGVIKSLTSFFDVPKGKEDIRMVYDGTINGFNESIEVPKFGMPTLNTHLRSMMPGYNMVDADVGECFLNFHLHSSLQPYVGVDLSRFMPTPGKANRWVYWHRAGMGLKSSPYQACQAMMVFEEIVKGDRKDQRNPFRWDKVVMNLPGAKGYDPARPWVYKLRLDDGKISCDIFIYVDDLRITGATSEEAWLACKRVASFLSWLGIQDAPRKRRDASRTAGAWAGSVVFTTDKDLVVLVTEEKWNKGKAQVVELQNICKSKRGNRKRLQQIRGFLNYISATYPILSSYLMGLHLTIDGWRKGRESSGWRKPYEEEKENDFIEMESEIADNGPIEVNLKPRLQDDVLALTKLMKSVLPPLRRIRSDRSCNLFYGFGDASGSAFGSTLSHDGTVHFEYGQWCHLEGEESSNWRELANLCNSLERWVQEHSLNGAQMFIFTDNSTAESAFWKGTSRSKKLCDIILQMKCLALAAGLDLYVVHVSGKRMQSQGTDGLSRGDHSQGVMTGIPMEVFIPLHLKPTDRDGRLNCWINELVKGMGFKWLEPEEWFEEHHREGNFIWDVPPAAGDVVYEKLDKWRLKRPGCMHLVFIPRLITGLWRRILSRRSDCYLKIDWDGVWNLGTQYEPLLLFISFPYNIDRPFEERKNSLLEQFHRILSEWKLPSKTELYKRNLLRKFLQCARKIPSM